MLAPEASKDVSDDDDGVAWNDRYTWRVGGPNDIPCAHLRDIYRGDEPLQSYPSPFCTKSSCPMPGVKSGPRNPVNGSRVFVSDKDRVLLKSMAFGYVGALKKGGREGRQTPPTAYATTTRKRQDKKKKKKTFTGQ